MLRPTFHSPAILLVEDSDDDAFFFRYELNRACIDCHLTHLADGRACLAYLQAALTAVPEGPSWPHAIFLDLKLPEFTGFEILRWIAEHRPDALSSVYVLSGSEQQSDMSRALALGAAEYLVKPISSLQLRERLLRVAPFADIIGQPAGRTSQAQHSHE